MERKRNHFNSTKPQTPMFIIAYALFLYFSGLSLRRVSAALAMLGVKRSHEIRKWVYKFGASIWQVMPAKGWGEGCGGRNFS